MPGLDRFISYVSSFEELVTKPFAGQMNAHCWTRNLLGDFAEIVHKMSSTENLHVVEEDELLALHLSEAGKLAQQTLLSDIKLLRNHGAEPTLNLIKCYDRDDSFPFFTTDVYSFHVDAAPVPNDTFLCTYFGAPSQIIANADAIQKIQIPEIRAALKKLYGGAEEGFEEFLNEYYFNLHYQAKLGANIVSLGLGNMWRLAGDYPNSPTLPSIHRAPQENGEYRLMVIC